MKKTICIMSLVLLLLTSCKEVYRYTSNTFFAMNTVVTASVSDEIGEDRTEKIIKDYENTLSRTKTDSEIYLLNNGEDVTLSPETVEIIEKALGIARDTDYAFNPCMGTLTDLWDITSGRNVVPSEEEIQKALSLCDASLVEISEGKVRIPEGMKIDLGGVAKGYALERASEHLSKTAMEKGVGADFCISLGGNVSVSGRSQSSKNEGEKGWRVGLTNPFDKTEALGTLLLEYGYVSVSGGYERYFESDGKIYHHIFDSKTGYPSDSGLASVAVVSDDGLEADALSTALFVMGLDKASELYKKGSYTFEAVIITNGGAVYITEGLEEVFTLQKNAKQIKNEKVTIISK